MYICMYAGLKFASNQIIVECNNICHEFEYMS